MKAADFLKTTKGKVVSIGGGVSVAAVGIAAAVLLQGEGYRSIAVQDLTGTVTVVGTQNNGQAYAGEHLYSGDDVTVGEASELTMCMDNDKYVYADANTHFLLEASAASDDSRIKIFLDAGSELNVLESKLAENDTYEVDTPNSTMSVRGTTFRVTVYTAESGMVYTLNEVTEGTVKARLKTKDGKYNGVEQEFNAGQSALIRGNEDFSEFVMSGNIDDSSLDMDGLSETERLLLDYDNLPEDGMERLIELLENSEVSEKEEAKAAEPTPTVAPKKATPAPTPKPTPTPTPTPKPVKEVQLAEASIENLPTIPVVEEETDDSDEDSEYTEDWNDEDSGSTDNGTTPEPTATQSPNVTVTPTPTDTPGYTYDPSTGNIEESGTVIGKVTSAGLEFNGNAGTRVLPMTFGGTTYSFANGNINLEDSDDGLTLSESGLDLTTQIAAVKNCSHDANIQTDRALVTGYLYNGTKTYAGNVSDIDDYMQVQAMGEGEYTFTNNGSTGSNINWVESTTDSSGAVTQYRVSDANGITTYTIPQGATNAPTYNSNSRTITGVVTDPNDPSKTLNFTIDANGDFKTS